MAPSVSSFLPSIVPTCAQIALAIAIIRSKPPNVAIRNYVLQLRQHYRQGQRVQSEEEHRHYIDLVGYWQDQCQRAQSECDRLRSINIKLERSNQLLSHRMSATPDDGRPGNASVIQSPKRKTLASPRRASKRPKPPALKATEHSTLHTQEAIESDYDFLEGLGDYGKNLLESLYTAHGVCRTPTPNTEELCHALIKTSSALGKVIQLVTHNYEHLSRQRRPTSTPQSLGEDKSDFALAMTVSARTFMSVLVGITKMTDTSQDQRLPSLVICELAEVFKTALLAIESSARQTADKALSVPVQTQKGKSKAPAKVVKESIAARSLAHFLISLLGLLEKTNEIHQKLFEGFVFLLLERVGKRLYYCTFGRHRSTTVEGSLIPLLEPRDANEATRRDIEALGIRLELKALILILERAMGLAPHHMSSTTSKTTNNPARYSRTLSLKTLPAAPRTRLSVIAKDRLQRTLVTCMYGNKADDEFLDVLTKPVPAMRVSSLQNVAKIEDKDVVQWYKEEVWRLVGWDILAREGGW